MSGRLIRITPEQVRMVAGEFKSSSVQSQEIVTKLTSQINGMQGEWDGLTKEQFYTQFQEWQVKMREFVGVLDHINQQLVAIANRFEAADRGQAM
ncbi:MAG: type secretion protein EsxA [Symbiobacteriaceae bacterium]|jgi:WXG100 family type VII secretion target|nr:type secretion protein EsxA [Symbiobacteriaceae bacterium]